MSIIYEALKKTQDNRQTLQKPIKEVVIPRSNRMKIILLIMFAGLVTAFFAYQHFTGTDMQSQYKHVMAKKKISVALNTQENIKVNGTFFANKIKMAMINHQMYHVGDTINDMKIIGIETDNVKFRTDQGDVSMRVTA